MVTVLLKREFRFTLATIPESIFRYAKGNFGETSGEFKFDILDAPTVELLRIAISNHFGRPITTHVNNGIVEYSYAIVTAAEQQQRQTAQNAGATPAPGQVDEEPRCPVCDHLLSDCDCERCEDCEELIDRCTCQKEHPAFRDVPKDGSEHNSLRGFPNLEKITPENLTTLIASKLDNDAAGRAKMLMDRTAQYNRLMANLMTMQNEITRLSSSLGADPIVSLFREKIDGLVKNEHNMIKEIYFTNNYLVIKTDHIITNPLKDGKKRDIGEMEFYVRLDAMLGTRVTNEPPIIIRNCTREDLNAGQECGHVNLVGQPCFGTWTEPILKCLINKDLEQLVDLLVRYIRTPNEDDVMGRPIQMWPIVEEANEARTS
jgi:hypothetical protein